MSEILTVGHSSHSLDVFLGLLQGHQVQVLVDVRSQPFSRYSPQFNEDALQRTLPCKYVLMGAELGGRPAGERFYDKDGRVLYSLVAESPQFLEP